VVATDHSRVALPDALGRLRSLGIEVLMVEGGAEVITGLLHAGLVDRIVVAVAPLVIGAGTSAVAALGVTQIADAIRLCNRSIVPVGDDVLLAWDVDANEPPPPM
jgi:riboflavin biosynthesis pyrimidine reductase